MKIMPQPTQLSKEYRDGKKRIVFRARTRDEQIKVFWEKVKIGKPEECWLWQGATCGTGLRYGNVYFGGKLVKARRVAYEIEIGKIPNGLLVCHKCDNPLCINPTHLFIGTCQDNVDDKVRKGRQGHGVSLGEAHGRAIITASQAMEVRRLSKLGMGHREISSRTGVSKSNVSSIVRGRTWGHVQ